jgi:DNA polymerase-3 subunit gamma/tau
MSYQVLARKYRPTSFQELEGQEHVLQALINALDNERLHHAYLFTGTRGVGKTTIARILARCLNCETGVTSRPCGECNSCREISEGRSVDLIEVDAASRTGVDDMRELLDNVQYMPTVSRFKIYLIDEVHMLSKSSFNAMLKTLEEPPEHVKFLFATTDPKKLPITVLSRCLQFNLKNLSPEQIVHHLGTVLKQESISYDDAALWQLGHAADGSMRDALSLSDQAISFGDNEIREAAVTSMLGTIDQQQVYALLDAVASEDGAGMLSIVAGLSDFAPDYAALLDDLLAVLHRVALAHAVPGAVDNAQGDRERVLAMAQRMGADQVQLLYQIGLIGQRDLPLAPMPRIGFEMVLLRMMSFLPGSANSEYLPPAKPEAAVTDGGVKNASPESTGESPIANLLSAIKGEAQEDETAPQPEQPQPEQPQPEQPQPEQPPVSLREPPSAQAIEPPTKDLVTEERHEPDAVRKPELKLEPKETDQVTAPEFAVANWPAVLEALALSGVTATLAANCQLDQVAADGCVLKLEEHHASLWNASHEQRIAQALGQVYGREVKVSIEVGSTNVETPAQMTERVRDEEQAKAVAEMQNDEHVQQLIENFNGRLDTQSISPLTGTGTGE